MKFARNEDGDLNKGQEGEDGYLPGYPKTVYVLTNRIERFD